jgi:hypothetical protein
MSEKNFGCEIPSAARLRAKRIPGLAGVKRRCCEGLELAAREVKRVPISVTTSTLFAGSPAPAA